MNRPAPQTSTDRPTAAYPTADHLARIEREEAAHRQRLADLWADRTPTEELPVVTPSQHEQAARFVRTSAAPRPAPFVRTNAPQNEGPIQDMGRPGPLSRPSMRWHPSLMQLAIGAALVLALLGACNVAAIQAHREARAYCHALVVSDWARAERECRGTGSGTPVPEQIPSSPHTPASAPAQAPQAASPSPSPSALTRVTSPSSGASQPAPSAAPASGGQPDWVTRDTHAPYSKDDPAASPLDLPRCTTAPDTPMPCLASLSSDGSRAVVLEEDASLTGLVRR